jgi:hypothetical protein
MTDVDDWDDQDEADEDDGWYDDDDDYREPDPEDSEIARAYGEYAEHCEQVHGGAHCDCRPSLPERLASLARDAGRRVLNARARLLIATREPRTLRIGPAEVTVRLRADRKCSACSGRGWFYTLDRSRKDDRPPGYNGTSLCGCGSAIGKLAETRRYLRSARSEPPF